MFSAFFSQARRNSVDVRVVAHRQHADEVGEERVGRPLELGVLVQEVVEVPALVADPEVVALALDHVGEGHEVGRHDLVHVPERVEGVELVVARPSPRSARSRSGGAGVAGCSRSPQASTTRSAGSAARKSTVTSGMERPQPPGDGDVALDVAEADRARQPEHAARAACARGRGRRSLALRGMARDRLRLHGLRPSTKSRIRWLTLTGVAAVQPVAAPLERHQARAGDRRGDLLRVRVGDDLVLGAVERERRHGGSGRADRRR